MSDLLTLRARVAAPMRDVHGALTDAGALTAWLAEHAEVDLPGRYAFWGRYTPEGDEPRQRPLHVDDRTVRFEWRLEGQDTTAEFRLDEGDERGTCVITLTQTHMPPWEEMLAQTGSLGLLHTFWALSIANLVDHLEGRPLTPKNDFTTPDQREVVEIAAPPARVFASLTDGDEFARWFGAKADIEPHLGGRFAMGGFDVDPSPAKIIEFETDRRFAMQWPDGMVSGWELEGSGGKTRLTTVQSGFDETRPPHGSWMGWLGGIAELRRYHELPDWRTIWLEVDVPDMPEGILTIDS
jgi:uncharacterized protein YndB with AHSA1/START domain